MPRQRSEDSALRRWEGHKRRHTFAEMVWLTTTIVEVRQRHPDRCAPISGWQGEISNSTRGYLAVLAVAGESTAARPTSVLSFVFVTIAVHPNVSS
jgi:hypothetical protein